MLTTNQRDLASDYGRALGLAAGAWVIDGNTSEATAREIVRLDDEGDPRYDELAGCPAPLSGEWADGPSPDDVVREANLNPETVDEYDREELLELFEQSFRDAHRDEVLRAASALL